MLKNGNSKSLVLELGCGMEPQAITTVRHDRWDHSEHIDIWFDLDVLPWGSKSAGYHESYPEKFWKNDNLAQALLEEKASDLDMTYTKSIVGIKDEICDRIIAIDVFEHLHLDIPQWLNECWRILKPGKLLHFQVPVWGTDNHLIDPTHQRGFHIQNFDYFCVGQDWHIALGQFYDPKGRFWQMIQRDRVGDNLTFTLKKVEK